MLAYFGSGTDVWPILRFGYLHRTFVYVDSLPESPHYVSGAYATIPVILEELRASLENDGIQIKSCVLVGSTATITAAHGLVLKVFLNTKDTTAWENPELAALLSQVETLFIKGYQPAMVKELPALQRIVFSTNCHPDLSTKTWAFDPYKYELKEIPEYDFVGRDGSLAFFIDCEHCGDCSLVDNI